MPITYVAAMPRSRAARYFNDPSDKTKEQFASLYSSRIGFIGISAHDEPHLIPDLPNHLRLHFNDINPSRFSEHTEAEILLGPNEAHAREIYNFVEAIQSREEEWAVFVHCSAGISRSGAISRWIEDATGAMGEEKFREANKQIQPNATLLRMLHRLMYESE